MQLLQIHFAQNLPILSAFCSLLLLTYFSNIFAGRIDASLKITCSFGGSITFLKLTCCVMIKKGYSVNNITQLQL